jgi:hypothetical protein
MGAPIEVSDVIAVLLKDGWHRVVEKTFEVGKFEFAKLTDVQMASGSAPGVSTTGARWKESEGQWVSCQMPNVIAVKFE